MSFEFDIRYTDLTDVKFLKEGLKDPEDLLWYPMSTPEEMETATSNWIGFSKYRASITAIHEEKPIGIATLYLMPYKKVAHHTLFYIFVDKKYRRRGVGDSLLKNLLHLAKNFFRLESIHCEVFGDCPLIPLLKKYGFEIFAEQENYLKTENGYLKRTLWEHFF